MTTRKALPSHCTLPFTEQLALCLRGSRSLASPASKCLLQAVHLCCFTHSCGYRLLPGVNSRTLLQTSQPEAPGAKGSKGNPLFTGVPLYHHWSSPSPSPGRSPPDRTEKLRAPSLSPPRFYLLTQLKPQHNQQLLPCAVKRALPSLNVKGRTNPETPATETPAPIPGRHHSQLAHEATSNPAASPERERWVGTAMLVVGRGVLERLLRQSLGVMKNQLITITEGIVKWFIKLGKEKYINIHQCKRFSIHQALETVLIRSRNKGLYMCLYVHISIMSRYNSPTCKVISSMQKEMPVYAWLGRQRRIIWVKACYITEVCACTHTYLNQMPNHFQMLQGRIAFVQEEEEKSLPFMSRYLGSGYTKQG